jgi:hypothetical protein
MQTARRHKGPQRGQYTGMGYFTCYRYSWCRGPLRAEIGRRYRAVRPRRHTKAKGRRRGFALALLSSRSPSLLHAIGCDGRAGVTGATLMRWLDMRRVLVMTFLAIAASIGSTTGAHASCAGPPGSGPSTLAAQVSAAPIAFVGTVIGTASNDRVAWVKVESIWTGPVIPTFVTVVGTPDQASAATSVDRTYRLGQRYLFVPFTASPPFQDNSCSATQVYSSQLDALKPAMAQPPAPGSDRADPTTSSPPFWVWPILAGALVVGIVSAWVVVRRSRQRESLNQPPLDTR